MSSGIFSLLQGQDDEEDTYQIAVNLVVANAPARAAAKEARIAANEAKKAAENERKRQAARRQAIMERRKQEKKEAQAKQQAEAEAQANGGKIDSQPATANGKIDNQGNLGNRNYNRAERRPVKIPEPKPKAPPEVDEEGYQKVEKAKDWKPKYPRRVPNSGKGNGVHQGDNNGSRTSSRNGSERGESVRSDPADQSRYQEGRNHNGGGRANGSYNGSERGEPIRAEQVQVQVQVDETSQKVSDVVDANSEANAEAPAERRSRPNFQRDNRKTVRVNNLSEDARPFEVRRLFSLIGPVANVSLPRYSDTGAGRGFGFVSYHRLGDAERAVERLNGYGFDNLLLRVELYAPRADSRSETTMSEAATETDTRSEAATATDTKSEVAQGEVANASVARSDVAAEDNKPRKKKDKRSKSKNGKVESDKKEDKGIRVDYTKMLTLREYEERKKKEAEASVESSEKREVVDKDFESMLLVGKKKTSEAELKKKDSDGEKKKEVTNTNKKMSIDEFHQKASQQARAEVQGRQRNNGPRGYRPNGERAVNGNSSNGAGRGRGNGARFDVDEKQFPGLGRA